MDQDVRELAEKVVHDVVQMASVAAQLKREDENSTPKNRGCNLQVSVPLVLLILT